MKNILLIIFCILSFKTFAVGQANTFEVDVVRVDKSGKGYVRFKSKLISYQGLPTCGSSHPYHLAFNKIKGVRVIDLASYF